MQKSGTGPILAIWAIGKRDGSDIGNMGRRFHPKKRNKRDRFDIGKMGRRFYASDLT